MIIRLLASAELFGLEPTAYSTRLVKPSPSVSRLRSRPSKEVLTVTTKLLVLRMVEVPAAEVTVVVTTVVKRLVLGLWFSVGVQIMIPLLSIVAPAGGLIN